MQRKYRTIPAPREARKWGFNASPAPERDAHPCHPRIHAMPPGRQGSPQRPAGGPACGERGFARHVQLPLKSPCGCGAESRGRATMEERRRRLFGGPPPEKGRLTPLREGVAVMKAVLCVAAVPVGGAWALATRAQPQKGHDENARPAR